MRRWTRILATALTGLVLLPAPPRPVVAATAPADVVVLGGAGAVSSGVAGLVSAAGGAVTRLGGADRYATAAAISAHAHPDGAPVVFVATGLDYPDAIAAGPAAAAAGGPILLTHRNWIPPATAAELARLAPDRIVVLGGAGAISDATAAALGGYAPDVRRLAGPDRFATAAAVSAASFAPGSPVAYITTGLDYVDALAAAPAAAHQGGPLLLVRPDRIPAEVAAELTRLAPSRIVVVGGAGVVSGAVVDTLAEYTAGPVVRLTGSTRDRTAANVANYAFPGTGRFVLATDATFPDAMTGSASLDAPVLFTRTDSIPEPTRQALAAVLPGHGGMLSDLPAPGDDSPTVASLQQALAERGFFRAEVDGVYGPRTRHAVVAFHKATDRVRSGAWQAGDWERLMAYAPAVPARSGEPNRIEIDLTRQVLYLIRDGAPTEVIPVSSGNGETFTNAAGRLVRAVTPRGNFSLGRHHVGWHTSYLGEMYNPWYFTGGYAVHGSNSVPAWPASHGCVRVPNWDSDWLETRLSLGLPVHVWR